MLGTQYLCNREVTELIIFEALIQQIIRSSDEWTEGLPMLNLVWLSLKKSPGWLCLVLRWLQKRGSSRRGYSYDPRARK